MSFTHVIMKGVVIKLVLLICEKRIGVTTKIVLNPGIVYFGTRNKITVDCDKKCLLIDRSQKRFYKFINNPVFQILKRKI